MPSTASSMMPSKSITASTARLTSWWPTEPAATLIQACRNLKSIASLSAIRYATAPNISEWRSDVEGFIPREIVEACVGDFYELPPQLGENYHCFFDPASGVPEGDSLAAVVSHKLGDRVIIDA